MSRYLGHFGSDNYSGTSPEIMKALLQANKGHEPAYGGDSYTKKATELLKKEFGKQAEVFFVFNGTGANVSGLSAMLSPFQSIICAETAHIQTSETGSIYALVGCKLLTLPSPNGKILPEDIESSFKRETFLGKHATQPQVVSISQTTEYGTLYSLEEIRRIAKICKKLGLYLHVDGCRMANAAASLGVSFTDFKDLGIDVLSFGGTKNGLMFGEAVIFLNPKLGKNFPFLQKQYLQLASKMRFISAQFIPYLEDKIWEKNAKHANSKARRLAEGLKKIPGIEFTQKVESNQLFFKMPKKMIVSLQKQFLFLVWDEMTNEVRLITSFDTQDNEIDSFISHVKKCQKC